MKLLPILRNLAPTNRRLWRRCSRVRYIGVRAFSEYAHPFRWQAWWGSYRVRQGFFGSRRMVALFLARLTDAGKVRAVTLRGFQAERVAARKKGGD